MSATTLARSPQGKFNVKKRIEKKEREKEREGDGRGKGRERQDRCLRWTQACLASRLMSEKRGTENDEDALARRRLADLEIA